MEIRVWMVFEAVLVSKNDIINLRANSPIRWKCIEAKKLKQ